MSLIRNDAFVESAFAHVADGEALPDGAVVVTLSRFLAERESLMLRNAPLGVRIASHETPDALGRDVHHFAIVELEFPKFRDGRGYSSARVLRDQWLFMRRVGVDSFEVRPGTRLEDFRAAMAEQTVFYQRSSDKHASVFELRHTSGTPAE